MEKKNRKLPWWQLYLLLPAMFLLLAAEQVDPLPGVSEEITDVLIIVLIFGSMVAWIWANQVQVNKEYMDRYLSDDDIKITVYEPLSQQKKNRELSHGVPQYTRSSPTREVEKNIEMEDLGSEK